MIRALAELRGEYDYDITPINRSYEKMICCTVGPLQFRDSLCILNDSLAKLIEDNRVGNLAEAFPILRERHPCCPTDADLDLLLRPSPTAP